MYVHTPVTSAQTSCVTSKVRANDSSRAVDTSRYKKFCETPKIIKVMVFWSLRNVEKCCQFRTFIPRNSSICLIFGTHLLTCTLKGQNQTRHIFRGFFRKKTLKSKSIVLSWYFEFFDEIFFGVQVLVEICMNIYKISPQNQDKNICGRSKHRDADFSGTIFGQIMKIFWKLSFLLIKSMF